MHFTTIPSKLILHTLITNRVQQLVPVKCSSDRRGAVEEASLLFTKGNEVEGQAEDDDDKI